ncbi:MULTISPECIES: cytochrome P450 [unclassified Sporosarcina]|uniref:cytochrome P450 n=1 Tax=unclassified Sporosarcina TaxID=2647733 RepID=UPI000C165454|nr:MULTISPECIES: cytochrome P450 [unclassified Sporosarcina]PIC97943.1 pyridine nucleotide-disulfide oxidoreductase [Sporosarcina sp. P29]PID05137.1 pyridine nucleotide-disulfide oxidoreductase [Sporosarcina sp. P30]PID08335.1 pyridine nucleotide-disulfide oxidoreductase [Sporosarcina sp. P31]PID11447.1 pyridine nucleotide-disulfide oxidoreductase [Sporosarcina sp. P32b]
MVIVQDIATPRLQNYLEFVRDPIAFFTRVQPLGDVISLKTGISPTFVVNSPDAIREILIRQDQSFIKGRTTTVLRRTVGEGLLTTEGERHATQKKYIQPAFYKDVLERYAYAIVDETEKLVGRLEHEEELDIHTVMMRLTLSIITRTMFSTDVSSEEKELADAVTTTIEQSVKILFSPVMIPASVPTKANLKHKEAIQTLEAMIDEVLVAAKEHPEWFEDSLLGMMMAVTDEAGNGLPDKEVRDQMMTMLLAGHETTANLLGWLFAEIAGHPKVEKRLLEELNTADLVGNPFNWMRELPYTQQIIEEGLRLYPPAWLIYRELDEAVEMFGRSFKKGSTFMICPYAVHRNEKVFPDPSAFDPDRFAVGNKYAPFSYFPFGGGSRSCIGSRFALLEATLILSVLYKKFLFHNVRSNPPVPEPLISLRIKDGWPMKVEKRI